VFNSHIPAVAKFYESASTFKCVSNPTIEIPFARVNDDYCDCPDGSDEPGTAACAHLSPLSPHTLVDTPVNGPSASAALPGFFCQNKGHLPSYVPFANVNDGVCDYDLCCDGSEEWENIGGVKCKDRCDEIGKEWRKKDAARAKSASNAAKKRAELVKEAARLKQTVREQVELVNTQIEAGQVKLTQLERELEEIRRNEAGKVVKAGKTSGKLGILIAMAQRRTQELRSALLVELAQKSINKARLEKLEAIMTTFKEEYNPNFNDEGVKRAVRAWEEYVASGSADIPSAHPRDIESIVKDDKENGVDWDSYEASEETVQPDETDARMCCL
jgi:protein kinase C substrate 80K-H